jgi:hypothetical protein
MSAFLRIRRPELRREILRLATEAATLQIAH